MRNRLDDYAIDFIFADEKLSDYGLMLCDFNGESMETISTGHHVDFNTVTPIGLNRFYKTKTKYNEPLSAIFQVCKIPCDTDNVTISVTEENQIVRWLSQNDCFHNFKLYQKGYEDIYFKGAFTSIDEIKIAGRLCGFELTFTTDSSYGYLDPISLDFITTSNEKYYITDFSNEIGYIYPDVFTCKCLSSGDLVISNSMENRKTEIKNCLENEIISLDGQKKLIFSDNDSHKIYNDFNYDYFRLANTYRNKENIITTSIPCEIHIEYSPIRKVGLG